MYVRFFFDFNLTYVGAGMICPYLINASLLLGSILSWGVMWPLIAGLKGDWYPSDLPESSMRSLQGYKVCFQIDFPTISKNMCNGVPSNLPIFMSCIGLHLCSSDPRGRRIQFYQDFCDHN